MKFPWSGRLRFAQTQSSRPDQRLDNRYVYVLSDYGRKAAAMLVIVRNRILRPIAGRLFVRCPNHSLKPNSKLQAQYRRTTRSFNDLIALLKAA